MEEGRRVSTRLQGYNYEEGTFFLTICAYRRKPLFGTIGSRGFQPSLAGRIVGEEWLATARIRPEVTLDTWVLMPNHIHAIVTLPDCIPGPVPIPSVGAHGPFDCGPPARSLP